MKDKTYDKTFIIDTSVILHDFHSVILLSENGKNRIIIPETTLDEVDSKKYGFEDINFQAREFNRLIDYAKPITQYEKEMNGTKLSFVGIDINDSYIEMVSKEEYKVDITRENLNIVNDRKILEIARSFDNATVISNDNAMRIRARSMKLKAEPLRKDRYDKIEDMSFIEKIEINSTIKSNLENLSAEDFRLELSNFTNVEFICTDTGEHILALYKNKGFHIIDEKKLRSLVVNPRNREQIFFLNMLLDKDIPIVVCAGVSGSGKNLLTIQGALEFDRKNSEPHINSGIKYCRNTITAGDQKSQLGFLKGDENAKLSVFAYPLSDSISMYRELEQKKLLSENKSLNIISNSDFMEEKNIEVLNINQMRGTNLKGFLIFDEWQNSSAAVNKLMLTRVINGSKVVIIGDLHQIDHPHLSKYNNALNIMLRHAKYNDLVGGITMSKVQRGKIAEFAEEYL